MKLAAHCRGNPALTPLVLLHGFMGSADDWQPLVPFLQNHFYLVMIDLPGHGDNLALLETEDNFSAFAEALKDTLGKQGLAACMILGYSLGGRLAMAFARDYPEYILKLLLEGAHPGLQNETERQLRQDSDRQWAERFSCEPVAEVLQDWYQQPVFSDLNAVQRERLIELRKNQSGKELAQVMMKFSLSAQPDFRPVLKQCQCPVHYFYGEQDAKFKGLGQSLLAESCLSGLHRIDGSGHNIHREQPEALAAAILNLFSASCLS